jgi:hypothetical protein
VRLGPASRTRCLLVPGQAGFRLPRPRSARAAGEGTPAPGPFTCHPLWSSQHTMPSAVAKQG